MNNNNSKIEKIVIFDSKLNNYYDNYDNSDNSDNSDNINSLQTKIIYINDPEIIDFYNLESLPLLLFYNQNGEIIYKLNYYINLNEIKLL